MNTCKFRPARDLPDREERSEYRPYGLVHQREPFPIGAIVLSIPFFGFAALVVISIIQFILEIL